MSRRIRLLRDSLGDPVADTALSRVILEGVARGAEPETLRLYRPRAHVAFGSRDAHEADYPDAVRAARQRGFEAVERLAGGRAAVFHHDTIAFAWAVADPQPQAGITTRFEESAELIRDALAGLGVDARVGQVPGEYCPGDHSVNASGRVKLAGIGQRVVRGGAHLGGVIVVDGAEAIRDVLVPVYRALGLDWDPETTGSIAGEAAGVGYGDVEDALLERFSRDHGLDEAEIPAELRAAARGAGERHRVPRPVESRP